MTLSDGERLHVILRRRFETDVRRHLVGEVVAVGQASFRLRGWSFIWDASHGEWVRSRRAYEWVLFLDSGTSITLLPEGTDTDTLEFQVSDDGRLLLTDGSTVAIEVNEFGPKR